MRGAIPTIVYPFTLIVHPCPTQMLFLEGQQSDIVYTLGDPGFSVDATFAFFEECGYE